MLRLLLVTVTMPLCMTTAIMIGTDGDGLDCILNAIPSALYLKQ